MTHARYLGLRLFLEGIEVDAAQVSFSAGVNRGASASISIPASDTALQFLPRTLVHVFYLESSYHLDTSETGAPISTDLRKALDVTDPRHWRLLFCGEIRGHALAKVGGSRTVSLSCGDLSSYWDHAKVYWGSGNVGADSFKRVVFSNATHLMSSGSKVKTSKGLLDLLRAAPASNPKLPGLLGGLVSLLEAATGVFGSSKGTTFRGVNDFMSQAELRLHLTRMIGASPDDDTSAAFLNSATFQRYLRRVSMSVKSTASIMDLVGLLLGKIYHQYSSVLAPPLVGPNGAKIDSTIIVPTGVRYNANDEVGSLLRDVIAAQELLAARYSATVLDSPAGKRRKGDLARIGKVNADPLYYVASPTEEWALPDSGGHNAFAGKCYSLGLIKRKNIENVTVNLRAEVKAKGGGAAQLAKVEEIGRGVYYAVKLQEAINTINSSKKNPAQPSQVSQFPNHDRLNFRAARRLAELAVAGLGGRVAAPTKKVSSSIAVDSRLNSFLFMPDLYMAVPPKCNVLFPDQVQSIYYSQDMLSEITRLWLHSRTRNDVDRKDMYFSPNTSIIGGPSALDATNAVKKGISFTMNHELFSGVIAAIDGVGDNDVIKDLHKAAVAADIAAGSDGSNAAGQARYSPNEYLQRAANYTFFARRYSGRNMSLTCRFSPQIVPGLPAIVLDPIINKFVEDPSSKEGTHYIGIVEGVEHTLDAEGGAQTRVYLGKCRRHNEGIDLFGGKDTGIVGETSVEKIKIPFRPRKKTKADRPYSVEVDVVEGFTVEYKNPGPVKIGTAAKPTIDPHDLSTLDGFAPAKGKKYEVRVREDFKHDVVNTDLYYGRTPANGADQPNQTSPYNGEPLQPGGGRPAGDVARAAGNTQGTWRTMTAHDPRNGANYDGSVSNRVYVDLYEIRPARAAKMANVAFAFEDTASPPWHSPIYLPANIGSQYYDPMLGCSSVLDAVSIGGKPAAPAMGGTAQVSRTAETDTGPTTHTVEVPASLLAPVHTVAEACELLSDAWLKMNASSADLDLFIDTYTNRSFASLHDIFGSQNPHLSQHVRYQGQHALPDIEGFHGNAFGRYSNLESAQGGRLGAAPLTGALGAGEERNVDGRIDPRLARYERVEAHKLISERRAKRTNTPENPTT